MITTAPQPRTATPERFTLTLQALPGRGAASAIIRLRRFLKAALRSYGLRCVRCEAADSALTPLGAEQPRRTAKKTAAGARSAAGHAATQPVPSPRTLESEIMSEPNQQPTPTFLESLIHGQDAVGDQLRGVGDACDRVASTGRAIVADACPSFSFTDLAGLAQSMQAAASDWLRDNRGGGSPGADSPRP
jgi:hypothetical protein